MVSRKYNRKKRKVSRRIQRNRRKLVSLKKKSKRGGAEDLSKNYTYGFQQENHEYSEKRQREYIESFLKEISGAVVTDLENDLTNNQAYKFEENIKDKPGQEGKTLTEYLGRGKFGNVVSVNMTKDSEEPIAVAVKQINLKRDQEQNKKAAKDLLEEYKIHSNLKSDNITNLLGVIDPYKVGIKIVMENCPGISLQTYFLSRDTIQGKDTKNKEVLHQIYTHIQEIARALEYISNTDLNNNIVHRDISLKNILLCGQSPPYEAKLSDFGLAQKAEIKENKNYYFKQQPIGALPINLYAPDALHEPQLKFGFENDVWSFGLLMYGLLFLNKKHGKELVGKATKYSNEEWYMKTHINRKFNEEEKKELFGIGFIGKYLRPREVLNKLNVENPENNLDPENLEDLKANHFYQTIIKYCFFEPEKRYNIKTIVERTDDFIKTYVGGAVKSEDLIPLYTSQNFSNKDNEEFKKLFPIESNYLHVLFYGCKCAEDDGFVTASSTSKYMDPSEENDTNDTSYLDVRP